MPGESKIKPADKLVAHSDYGLFWTGSSTLPRLHHSFLDRRLRRVARTYSLDHLKQFDPHQSSKGVSSYSRLSLRQPVIPAEAGIQTLVCPCKQQAMRNLRAIEMKTSWVYIMTSKPRGTLYKRAWIPAEAGMTNTGANTSL